MKEIMYALIIDVVACFAALLVAYIAKLPVSIAVGGIALGIASVALTEKRG